MTQQPVLLLVFNRPDTTRQVFEAIKRNKPSRLYIAADGPRVNRPDDTRLCAETRKITSAVDWNCQVTTLFREENLGCGRAISEAITWFFEHEESGIILEDDCVPNDTFFSFCTSLLDLYKDDERVMMISGTSYIYEDISKETDYYFCRYFSVWGWATWRRAWNFYDFTLASWPSEKQAGYLQYVLSNETMAGIYAEFFDIIAQKKTDTWDLQWVYACMMNNGLAATSSVNLIRNIGAAGTHTVEGASEPYLKMPVVADRPADHQFKAKQVKVDHVYEKIAFTTLIDKFFKAESPSVQPGILRKTLGFVKRRVKRLVERKNPVGEVVTVAPASGNPTRRALLSYLKDPVNAEENSPLLSGASNKWESREIARLLTERGFTVDVIDWNNQGFVPAVKYDLILDIALNLQRLAGFADHNCFKILHCTGSYWTFANKAELERVDALEKRRGGIYSPRRLALYPELQERSARIANACSLIGNDVTLKTYPGQYQKKTVTIPVTTSILAFEKNMDDSQTLTREFLWFNSSGMVHKGLDLLLEIFIKNRQWKLNVVGSPEPDLFNIYESDLRKAGNIRFYGFIDPQSKVFQDILDRSFCFVCPSCSEGMSGSSATCMQAGLYPVISRNTGIDLPQGAGSMLQDCEIGTIEKALTRVMEKTDAELRAEIRTIKSIAGKLFSRTNFTRNYSSFLDNVLSGTYQEKN